MEAFTETYEQNPEGGCEGSTCKEGVLQYARHNSYVRCVFLSLMNVGTDILS